MKLKRFFSFLLFAAVITAFTACDEDEDTSVPVDVTLNFTAPSDTITSFTWAEGKATFTDLNRGKEYELDLSQSSVITLSSGLYNITVEGAIASASGEILCNVCTQHERQRTNLCPIDFDRFGAIDLHSKQLPYSQRDLCNGHSQ